MGCQIKYSSGHVNGACNDKDFADIRKMNSLVNPASYHKEFGFSSYDINSVVYCLNNWSIMTIDM